MKLLANPDSELYTIENLKVRNPKGYLKAYFLWLEDEGLTPLDDRATEKGFHESAAGKYYDMAGNEYFDVRDNEDIPLSKGA